MTVIFNQHQEKEKRRQLRNRMPGAEVIMWSRLKNKQLNGLRFRRQYSIGRYVVDFYCPGARLIVEIDGDSHFTNEAEQYDKQREEYMKSLGLHILRFTNSDVGKKLPEVLEAVLRAV